MSFLNDDGSSRQQIILKLRKGAPVRLVADPTNPKDRWAVKVFTEAGKQIGWLRSDARDADAVLKGEPIPARIHAIDGGTNWFMRLLGKKHVGVVLQIDKGDPDWTRRRRLEEVAQQYDRRIAESMELEKQGDLEQAVEAYRSVIGEVREFTINDPHASAHRGLPVPVDRLSLLLERRKQFKEALKVIDEWLSTFDPVQPGKAARETIVKRGERIRKKLV